VATTEELGRNNHINPYGSKRTWSVSNTPPQNNVGNGPTGRFPANIIHDGSDEVLELFPNTNPSKKANRGVQSNFSAGIEWVRKGENTNTERGHNDNGGSTSRFFYCAKTSKSERNKGCEELEEKKLKGMNAIPRESHGEVRDVSLHKNNHPTVKPQALMQYLIKLITPKNGVVLDMFAGSGSTLVACKDLGYNYIGIEKQAEYIEIIKNRLNML